MGSGGVCVRETPAHQERRSKFKSAVFELSGGGEEAAGLVVSAPVDEMVHLRGSYRSVRDQLSTAGSVALKAYTAPAPGA